VAALGAPQAGEAAPPTRLVVGSKNFTESRILGELLAVLLERALDVEVEHASGLGGTLVCFEALTSGAIDLYPDYTGTGWAIVLKEEERAADPLRTYLVCQRRYRAEHDVEWLEPFGFANSYALALGEERAEELGVTSVSGLLAHQDELAAGFSIEFMNREDGWPGLSEHYGLDLASVRALEHGLAYEAVSKGAVDLVDAYTTDGKLVRFDLRLLEDDQGFFPPYDAAPIVRGETLRALPGIRTALAPLAFAIDEQAMRALNASVEEGGLSFRAAAEGFLRERGLIDADAREAPERRRTGGFLAFIASRWRETLELGLEHVLLTAAAVALATLLAVPLGIWITHHALARRLVLGTTGVLQTIPSLALLAFMIAVPGLGLSVRSAIVALFLYALLPIVRNTTTGLSDVDPDLVDAARGMGLTQRQILLRVQLPLATRTIMAGIRTATVISIGVATLAAFIGAGGLGEPIVTGLYLNDTRLILSGALPAALLALVADALLGLVERLLTPEGVRLAERRGA
jgi:osmoprotectant transport system permease protein